MKKLSNVLNVFVFSLVLVSADVRAQFSTSIEIGVAGFSRNDARIPGNSGTNIDFSNFDRSPKFVYRIMPSYKFSKHHEVRGLWAPLVFDVNGRFSELTNFNGQAFAANVDTAGSYKFNSYRLGYIYHVNPGSSSRWRLGIVAKIRDAYVSVTQGSTVSKKANIGFVPLIHLGFENDFSENLILNFDVDALGASQGRAIDALVALRYKLTHSSTQNLNVYIGYRTIEGGANVEEVYNFAWIHQGVLGLDVAL